MAGTGTAHLRAELAPILTVENLVVEFPTAGRGRVQAVSGVSFDVLEGETLGVVGESGCGKSTTGRAIMQLPKPTGGSVRFAGAELTTLPRQDLRRTRTQMQMIFQDPVSSLNPRRKVRDIVAEGPAIWHRDVTGSPVIGEILEAVGLDPEVVADRWPHELSGGQCQRVCIARALILDPKLLICDESVSALDVSVQAQILNLLEDMKARYQLTMIFISHDLGVIKNISDRVVVMYLGKVCEVAPADTLYASPAHPYTRLLLDSIPSTDPGQALGAAGAAFEQPSAVDPPSGCRFRTRCPRAAERCSREEPKISQVAPGHFVACHFPEPAAATGVA